MDSIYLKKLEIIKDIAPLKAGLTIEFKLPITFLVGDNGVGKSTIMDALGNYFNHEDDTYLKRELGKSIKIELSEEKFETKFVDFHAGDKKFSSSFGSDIQLQLYHMKASSGQTTLSLFQHAKFEKFEKGLVLLDEPCRGLSIKNQHLVASFLIKLYLYKQCQIIATTHSSIILQKLKLFSQIYSVQEQKDTDYKSFIKSMTPQNKKP